MNKTRKTSILISILVIVVLIITFKENSNDRDLPSITLEENTPTVILFSSTSCTSCIEMKKILTTLEESHDYDFDYIDVLVDHRENKQILVQYNVRMVPTTVFINGEGEQIDYRIGLLPEAYIISQVEKIRGDSHD